jgi:aerobic-type carbon monoxide dehydrogenase small subunit (CoxS/CutS family)
VTDAAAPPLIAFEVDSRKVEVPDDGADLLTVLRERLGLRSAKDGCSPQGQCGCCTVLVDGQPRVACVTPARRVRGRAITTLDGLDAAERRSWGEAFCTTGASQCGFCTPGIVMRLAGLQAKGAGADDLAAVQQALLAHLCRCTGWRTILDAWSLHAGSRAGSPASLPRLTQVAGARDLAAAAARATIEGRSPQRVAPEVALGQGGFADDRSPPGALVAVPDGSGGWAVGESLAEARAAAGKVQGRRTTAQLRHPLDLPPGDWAATLRTTWVEPAYLEIDASWCDPGGEPATPLANGGAFGGKLSSVARAAARDLADRHGRTVRVALAREDAVRLGPKRPPVAGGVSPDGTGVLRVVATPGIEDAVAAIAPGLRVERVAVPGPPTSVDLRAAGWAEAAVLLAGAGAQATDGTPGVVEASRGGDLGAVTLRSPDGSLASAEVMLGDGACVAVRVSCGRPLDEVVVRSYCTGAAHMALGWVCSEGLAVDDAGGVHDLTIRSFGVLRAVDTPPISVAVEPSDSEPVNGSDAVFAAVAAAAWLAQGCPPDWPTGRLPLSPPAPRAR